LNRQNATSLGFIAIALWGLLALLSVGSAPTPPFLLMTICFLIGGVLGLIWTVATGNIRKLSKIPLQIFIFGTLGLFGYHSLYFSALRHAPAAEASLIAYLWPLLIVLMSGLLPNERLSLQHVSGAILGFFGAALIISGDISDFNPNNLYGYLLALGCALIWSGYSVLSRKFDTVPTASVAVFCIGSAALSLPLHLILEDTVWPQNAIGWSSLILLGIGPVGLAFFVWDIAIKKGNIQIVGTASYAAPLLSTAFLVIAGIATPSWSLGAAAIMIAAGALLAASSSIQIKN
jgi:drug/metabolite transporter (DMT)-like permease